MPDVTWPNGEKPLPVEKNVVAEIDEELRRARVRTRGGERERSRLVALRHRIILDAPRHATRIHCRIGAQSKLHDEIRHHAKESRIGEVTVRDQIVEPVRPNRRPRACHVHCEIALRWSANFTS